MALIAEELKKMDPEPSMGWEVEKMLQAGREVLSWRQPWGKDEEKAQEASLLCTPTAAETTKPPFLPGGISSPAAL